MKKTFLYPLSIIGSIAVVLLFGSCQSLLFYSLTTPDTKTSVQSEIIATVNLTQKRVLIVTYDSLKTRDLAISLKNYMNLELTTCHVISERINIRQNEASDLEEFEKLKTAFKPDYLLSINCDVKRTRDFYLIGQVEKKIRDLTCYFNLKTCNFSTEQPIIWKGEAAIKHLYDEGHTATMKKIATQMREKMQQDLILK